MAADVQHRVKLPPAIMAALRTVASDQNMSAAERLEAVLILVFGYALFQQQDSIDGRQVALPNEQWLEVCGFLVDGVYQDRVTGVNLGLSWMNKGPTSYND